MSDIGWDDLRVAVPQPGQYVYRQLEPAERDTLGRAWLRDKLGVDGVIVDPASVGLSGGDIRAAVGLIETLLDVAPDIERPAVRTLDRCVGVVARILTAQMAPHDGIVNVWAVLDALNGPQEPTDAV